MIRPHAVWRIAASLALALACVATSCVVQQGIAVAPPDAMPLDSALSQTVALTQRIGARYGFHAYTDQSESQEHFALCMARDSYILCEKTKGGEVQLRIYQAGPRFTARADSLNRELMDSLRTTFGAARVRTCGWRLEAPPKPSGCRTPGAQPSGSG